MRYLLLICLLAALPAYPDQILHREKSLYRNIIVNQKGDRRCLVFSVKRQAHNQTCIDLKKPDRIIFPYVRMTFSGLLVQPEPARVLMIGLGGGTISNVLLDIFPDLEIDLVEVDEAVIKVAREYFNFVENERTHVYAADGRVFTRRAQLQGKQYDLIILDAFTGEYIPEHLMTVEFLQEVKSLLTPNGAVIANTFSSSALYAHESQTYTRVFGPLLNLKMPRTGNRVIVSSLAPLPDNQTLINHANKLQPRFDKYAIDLLDYVARFDRTPDWDTEKRPLTDQFSPANLLRGQSQ